jgi:hypothetical protein
MLFLISLFIVLLFVIITNIEYAYAQSNLNRLSNNSLRITGNITTTPSATNWLSDPLTFLSHPFILVLLGSTISGALIAFFTQIWQQKQKELEDIKQQKQKELELDRQENMKKLELDRQENMKKLELDIAHRQKELELKITLVDRISSSVASIIVSILLQIVNTKGGLKDRAATYEKWEISSRAIAYQLRAFFPNTNIADDWEHFYELINNFYSLVFVKEQNKKLEYKDKLHQDTFLAKEKIAWNDLLAEEESDRIKSIWALGDIVLEKNNDFVDTILKSHIMSF